MNYAVKIMMVCFFIGIAVVDLKTFRIPDALLIAFVLVLIIAEFIPAQTNPMQMRRFAHLATAAFAFMLFAAVWHFSGGIGFGDVKYAAVLGFALGPEKIVTAFLAAAILGIFVYTLGVLLFAWPKTKKIPYAPFLSAGAVASLVTNFNFIGRI